MATPTRGGRLPGYAQINQSSLSCFIGLALARKCGIDDPALVQALAKCQGFYNTFTGRGAIPYGVHSPNSRDYDNNGMSGLAALAMSFVGDREAARFFSRQVATDYDRLETGHATHFFNVILNLSQIDFKRLGVDELISMFGHEAPQVRRRVQWEFLEREGDFHGNLGKLIQEGSDFQQKTAIGFYGYKCPPEWAQPRMRMIAGVLNDPEENPEVRAQAASALAWQPPNGKTHFQDILHLLLEDRSADEYGLIDESLGRALTTISTTPFADGLVKDKARFYRAVRKLSQNPRQGARGNAMRLLSGMPPEDFEHVADEVQTGRFIRRSRRRLLGAGDRGRGLAWCCAVGWSVRFGVAVADGDGGAGHALVLALRAWYSPVATFTALSAWPMDAAATKCRVIPPAFSG